MKNSIFGLECTSDNEPCHRTALLASGSHSGSNHRSKLSVQAQNKRDFKLLNLKGDIFLLAMSHAILTKTRFHATRAPHQLLPRNEGSSISTGQTIKHEFPHVFRDAVYPTNVSGY